MWLFYLFFLFISCVPVCGFQSQGFENQRIADRGRVRLSALAGQPAEDAPLRHLQPGGDGRYSGQRGREPGYVGLHVAQQLLQLVQHCNNSKECINDLMTARKKDQLLTSLALPIENSLINGAQFDFTVN